jgi:hypothetical protein
VTAKEASAQSLDDVMLAMDVVDTLRHRQLLIERELNSDDRDQKLIERLREIYTSQGMEVTDEILATGVAALKEDRFVYSPPEENLTTKMAHLYVSRDRWMKWAGLALALTIIAWLAYSFFILGPVKRLPDDLAQAQQQVFSLAKETDAKTLAKDYYDLGISGLASGDTGQAKSALNSLTELSTRLEQIYTLKIVSRPGEPSGIWRIPDRNKKAMNFYIIVEAVDSKGKRVPQYITSEEDGKTKQVSKWGIRVDEKIFNRVRADKQDDGIIQNNVFGQKKRQYITPDYNYPTTGASIYKW